MSILVSRDQDTNCSRIFKSTKCPNRLHPQYGTCVRSSCSRQNIDYDVLIFLCSLVEERFLQPVHRQGTLISIARRIARNIRTSSGGLPCVKALGLRLDSRNLAQVSMNLTDFERTPVGAVFREVRRQAAQQGVTVAESELIGLIPRAALDDSDEWLPTVRGFHAGLILENRLGI